MYKNTKTNIRVVILPILENNKHTVSLYELDPSSKKRLDLTWANEALQSIKSTFDIKDIKIIGGDLSLLSSFYSDLLFHLCASYCNRISVFADFNETTPSIIKNLDIINVFFDLKNKSAMENIKQQVYKNKIVNIKTFTADCIDTVEENIRILNKLNIKSWEIIPKIGIHSYTQSEEIIKKYLTNIQNMKFAFQNRLQLFGILNLCNYNTPTVYLTPNNTFANIEIINNTFKMYENEDFVQYISTLKKIEKKQETFCKKCASKLMCMANYYIDVSSDSVSCVGMNNLLKLNKQKN